MLILEKKKTGEASPAKNKGTPSPSPPQLQEIYNNVITVHKDNQKRRFHV